MAIVFWSICVLLATIWGFWDWRIATTGWIIAAVFDIIIVFLAAADGTPTDEGY